jgi:hypothetical protein
MTINFLKTYGFRLLTTIVVCAVIFITVRFFLLKDDEPQSIHDKTGIRLEENDNNNTIAVDPLPDDKDRDGLTDQIEKDLGLSEVLPDTDNDGLHDNDEITVFKSDPLKFDTDGDGFGDGWEVLKGYNPAGPGVLPTEIN